MAENNAMNVRIVDGDDCCPQAMCVKVCNLVQEVRKTGASKKLIPSEKAVSDALKGRQELLVAGAAEGILGPSAATGLAQVLTAPSAGVSIVDAIKGRTMKWKNIANFVTETKEGITITNNGDGSFTLNGLAEAEADFFFGNLEPIAGRKGLMLVNGFFDNGDSDKVSYWSTQPYWRGTTNGGIFATFPNGGSVDIEVAAGTELNNYKVYMNLLDLTDIFGTGNEPSTLAEFTALFPNFPYAPNAGTLLPFKGRALKVTGFNQWDEQWLAGYYTQDGTYISGTGRICSKNWVPIFPSTNYFSKSPMALTFFFYDAGKNFITDSAISVSANAEFTTPANTRWCLWYCSFTEYGSVYNNDICISLSNPALNGTYKPYTETLVNIDAIGKSAKDADGNAIVPFPTGVNGVGTAFDQYGREDGVKAMREVDLGDISWIYSSAYGFYSVDIIPFLKTITNAQTYNMQCASRTAMPRNSLTTSNNGIAVTDSQALAVSSELTDADAFKASVAGVKLIYEAKEPVPFTWDEPFTLAFTAEEGGTIWLQPEGVDEAGVPVSAPMNLDIAYTTPAVSIITETTLRNLLDEMKTKGIFSAYTMTPDGAGNFDFSITV